MFLTPPPLVSGLFSSLAYSLHSVATRNKIGALGASGAVYALLSFFVYKFPETKVSEKIRPMTIR